VKAIELKILDGETRVRDLRGQAAQSAADCMLHSRIRSPIEGSYIWLEAVTQADT
jgi:hypothetical protein